jgi:hypothetical protein
VELLIWQRMYSTKLRFAAGKPWSRTEYLTPVARARRTAVAVAAALLGTAVGCTSSAASRATFGMQIPGIDNRQLALNIMHWLSRLI